MGRLNPCFGFVMALVATASTDAAAADRRVHSDPSGSDYLVTCDLGPFAKDYEAETGSGIALTDPYAVQRDADKGLVRLMDQGERRAKRYGIPRATIRAIVSLKDASMGPDKVDLVFVPNRLIVIHRSTANAGIFTVSDVYVLPYGPKDGFDETPLRGAPEVRDLVDQGLALSHGGTSSCTP